MKTATVIAAVLLMALQAHCGLFSDEAVELEAKVIPRLLTQDQVQFVPCKGSSEFWIGNGEFTLELEYLTSTQTITVYYQMFSRLSPLVISLPNGTKGLRSMKLTAKKVNSRGNELFIAKPKDTGAKLETLLADNPNVTEFLKRSKILRGYIIRSSWKL